MAKNKGSPAVFLKIICVCVCVCPQSQKRVPGPLEPQIKAAVTRSVRLWEKNTWDPWVASDLNHRAISPDASYSNERTGHPACLPFSNIPLGKDCG